MSDNITNVMQSASKDNLTSVMQSASKAFLSNLKLDNEITTSVMLDDGSVNIKGSYKGDNIIDVTFIDSGFVKIDERTIDVNLGLYGIKELDPKFADHAGRVIAKRIFEIIFE